MSGGGSRGTVHPSMSCSVPGQGDFVDDAASGESGVPREGTIQVDCDLSPKFVTGAAFGLSFEQKELLADMSFGAMLSLPHLLRVDRQFSLWIYSRVDPDQPAVQVPDGSFRPMDLAAVGRVTGLGVGTREIKFPHQSSCSDQLIYQDVCGVLNIDPTKKFITIADLEWILQNPIEPMTEDEKARQRTAFALLCGSCMFNPVPRHKNVRDPIAPELLLAVRDPSLIRDMNWNKYILDVLLACVRNLRAALDADQGCVYLTGFNLVPQVIYLDALSKGNGVVPGNPRLPLYSALQIKNLIVADTDHRNTSGRMKMYGKCKVRPYRALEQLHAATPGNVTPHVEAAPVGTAVENPICVSSDEGAVPDCKIYALSELPEYQSQVLEVISADVHDHMSSVNAENLNLKNHVESMLCSFMGMIDARNESNVQTVNTMLSRVLSTVRSLRVQKVDGALRFIGTAGDLVCEQDMVGKGEDNVATDEATAGNGAGGTEVNPATKSTEGTAENGAGGTEVNPATNSTEGGPSGLKIFNRRLKLRLKNYVAAEKARTEGASLVAGTSHTVEPVAVVPSPESLDLNRRVLLREDFEVDSPVVRRLEMNTPSRIQHGFDVVAEEGSGEKMEFVADLGNGSNPPIAAVAPSVSRNSVQTGLVESNISLVRHPIQSTSSVHATSGPSTPIAIPLATPISSGPYFMGGPLQNGSISNIVPQFQYVNLASSHSSVVDTSLVLGSTTDRLTDDQHHKRGYAQSSILGWVRPMSALKRTRVPDYSLVNSYDLMTAEQVSARKDEQYYRLLKTASFNELARNWFKHDGPITLVLNGADVRAQFLSDDGYLKKSAIEAILTLRFYPSSSGKIILGPNWAEHCKMQFHLAYSNFYWDSPEVKTLFDSKGPEATGVMAMSVIYVKYGWCLYVFDVAQAALHVVDPIVATLDVPQMLPKHQKYMEDTLHGFIKCAQTFWGPGTVPAYESWTPVYHPAFLSEVTDSGLQCLHHIMTFIPSQRARNLPSEMAGMLKRKFLRAIMTCSKNVGDLPVRLQMK